jgi:hypothetical protein
MPARTTAKAMELSTPTQRFLSMIGLPGLLVDAIFLPAAAAGKSSAIYDPPFFGPGGR